MVRLVRLLARDTSAFGEVFGEVRQGQTMLRDARNLVLLYYLRWSR
jgi:hypothetical protein